MHQIRFQLGLWGAYSVPPGPLAGFKGPASKRMGGEERGGYGIGGEGRGEEGRTREGRGKGPEGGTRREEWKGRREAKG